MSNEYGFTLTDVELLFEALNAIEENAAAKAFAENVQSALTARATMASYTDTEAGTAATRIMAKVREERARKAEASIFVKAKLLRLKNYLMEHDVAPPPPRGRDQEGKAA